MNPEVERANVLVIGGGFFGCSLALSLTIHGAGPVVIVERERDLLTRASLNNQARVHGGYHYPRSFATANRSWANLSRFATDWQDAVVKDIRHFYAIARHNSKVSAASFQQLYRRIGATVAEPDQKIASLFNPDLIEAVFRVEEQIVDATKLRGLMKGRLASEGVTVLLDTEATDVSTLDGQMIGVTCLDGQDTKEIVASAVFNCSYSGISRVHGPEQGSRLKHEIAELAMVELPSVLSDCAITVMDGPFFSTLPNPLHGMHSLTHVRYTPHLHWEDVQGVDPYKTLDEYPKVTRSDLMLRDAARYLPILSKAKYRSSDFEVKTVSTGHERDDARPIMVRASAQVPGYYSILGGKLDNIYDLLEVVDNELLPLVRSRHEALA